MGRTIGSAWRSREAAATDGGSSWNHRRPKGARSPRDPALRMLLTAQGTYAFHGGGLTTSCSAHAQELLGVDYPTVCKGPLIPCERIRLTVDKTATMPLVTAGRRRRLP
jgi:hypothetical protein